MNSAVWDLFRGTLSTMCLELRCISLQCAGRHQRYPELGGGGLVPLSTEFSTGDPDLRYCLFNGARRKQRCSEPVVQVQKGAASSLVVQAVKDE
ncbi:hypothetical protein NDU88_007795 [Pleurodeles waltl]|uniref:Uncharacterized protein n=1 Tax=Pleurodeles waltl TaxID=8319 RepID=A0AAV7RV36_PLEWA|nr:hypothetical protein NDU88_007795 [Pleurodeles waltl]